VLSLVKISKASATRGASVVDLRVPTASAVQAKIKFQIRTVLARVALALLVGNPRLRDVGVSREDLRQVAAYSLHLWYRNQSTRVREEL
jgi:uncharacterized protein YjiS (DUF1127 family)